MEYLPNVLVVDDRPENLLSVEAILEPLDVVIHKANSAAAALRCMLDFDFCVVLLDVEMPEIDGFETARLIRFRQRTQNVPIIFLTATDRGDSVVQRGYELGAVDFLVKPVQPDILRWKVSVFADLSRKARQQLELQEEQIARAEADMAARRAGLLSNASAALASSLNEGVMLGNLINVLVPNWADFAAVYKVEHDRELRMDGFSHTDRAAYTANHPMHTQGVSLNNARESSLVRAFEGRSALLSSVSTEQTSSPDAVDNVHEDFVRSLGLRYALLLPVRGRQKPVGVLGLYRSSGREFTEAEKSFAEDLGERIALAVTNAQLYEVSQHASRAKDQFLAVVSHELRTPLTAILGWVHILLSKPLEPQDVEKALNTIARNAKLQSDLIGDILDFSRFATGQFSVKFEDVDIRSLVEQCVETVRPVADQKKINLRCNYDGQSHVVAGDATRLQQVFSNLILNAVKFTPEGGAVQVAVNSSESQTRIQVTDTGMGIAPEFIPQVFDPFMQADSSSTRSHNGLGLGLAIVRHLVEIHRGAIAASSPGAGKGATFTVTLPLRDTRAKAS